MIEKETKFDLGKLKVPVTLLIAFRVIAIALWQLRGRIFWLFNFGYIGTSIGVGLVENMQIEGFFFYLLAGLYDGSCHPLSCCEAGWASALQPRIVRLVLLAGNLLYYIIGITLDIR